MLLDLSVVKEVQNKVEYIMVRSEGKGRHGYDQPVPLGNDHHRDQLL